MENKITAAELASQINSKYYYDDVLSEEQDDLAKLNDLVVIYPMNEDYIRFEGYIEDIFETNRCTTIYFNKDLTERVEEEYYHRLYGYGKAFGNKSLPFKIKTKWDKPLYQKEAPYTRNDKRQLTLSSNFPSFPFELKENDNLSFIGIVFDIKDLPEEKSEENDNDS